MGTDVARGPRRTPPLRDYLPYYELTFLVGGQRQEAPEVVDDERDVTVCRNCGEQYVDEAVTAKLLRDAGREVVPEVVISIATSSPLRRSVPSSSTPSSRTTPRWRRPRALSAPGHGACCAT